MCTIYDLERIRRGSVLFDISAESRMSVLFVVAVGPLAESHVTVIVQLLAFAESQIVLVLADEILHKILHETFHGVSAAKRTRNSKNTMYS